MTMAMPGCIWGVPQGGAAWIRSAKRNDNPETARSADREKVLKTGGVFMKEETGRVGGKNSDHPSIQRMLTNRTARGD